MIDLPDERLRTRVFVTTTDCWEWTGARTRAGYGRISWHGHVERVHRVVASLALGLDLADGRVVCHRCDNPPCFNPAHLFVGTLSNNTQDMIAKGRDRCGDKPHRVCASGHKLSGSNVKYDRPGKRRCRTCFNEGQRDYYHRRMAHDATFRARKHAPTREIRDLATAYGVEVDDA